MATTPAIPVRDLLCICGYPINPHPAGVCPNPVYTVERENVVEQAVFSGPGLTVTHRVALVRSRLEDPTNQGRQRDLDRQLRAARRAAYASSRAGVMAA